MQIDIDDRLYNDFVNWAKANNMSDDDINNYIVKSFKDRFMLDKYGDLNDKISKPKKNNLEVETVIPNDTISDTISEPIKVNTIKTKIIKSK